MSGKLNYAAVDTLIKYGSSTEIGFMLYLASICNEFGSIRDLSYKDVCLALKINKSTFYRVISSLVKKKLILANDNREWGLWTIIINNNVFRTEEDYKKGYLQINKDFLYSPEFREHSSKLKRFVLILLKALNVPNFKASLSTIAKWIGVSKEDAEIYIDRVKAWFEIKVTKCIYYISLKPLFDRAKKSNIDKELIHRLRSLLEKYKIPYTLKELQDTIILFHQYSKSKLLKLTGAIASTTISYKQLLPRVINSIVSNDYKKKVIYKD